MTGRRRIPATGGPAERRERVDTVALFGHHHTAEPTLLARGADIVASIAHLPIAVWLTVIPVVGGLAIAYVTHRLNLSRDRFAMQREDERRRIEDERSATRVRADIGFRIERHRLALNAAGRGDVGRWETSHDALVRRVGEADVIDALGPASTALMELLGREETVLLGLAARDPSASAPGIAASADVAALEAQFTALAARLAERETSASTAAPGVRRRGSR